MGYWNWVLIQCAGQVNLCSWGNPTPRLRLTVKLVRRCVHFFFFQHNRCTILGTARVDVLPQMPNRFDELNWFRSQRRPLAGLSNLSYPEKRECLTLPLQSVNRLRSALIFRHTSSEASSVCGGDVLCRSTGSTFRFHVQFQHARVSRALRSAFVSPDFSGDWWSVHSYCWHGNTRRHQIWTDQ